MPDEVTSPALMVLNHRPTGSVAYNFAPSRDEASPNGYRFVLRRRDRFPERVHRVPVSYARGNALSRDITTPWDGVRAATLFLRDMREVLAAKGYGWKEDITDKWMAHLGASPALDADDEAAIQAILGDAGRSEDLEGVDGNLLDGGDGGDGDDGEEDLDVREIDLDQADYRTLQALAKQHGISARQSADLLREALQPLAAR